MNKKDTIKLIASFLSGTSAATVVGTIIRTTAIATNPINGILLVIGNFVISQMVGEVTSNWTDEKIDQITEKLNIN